MKAGSAKSSIPYAALNNDSMDASRMPRTASSAPGSSPASFADIHNPGRIVGFAAALLFILIRFGMAQHLATMLTGHNLRLMYLLGVPAYAGVVLCGGIRRTYQARPAYYWTAFLLWMAVAVPFSSYKRGSLSAFQAYASHEFTMLFVIAGLALTWRECRWTMHVMAWSGALSVLAGGLFRTESATRLRLEFGMVSDPNDFAAHLLLVLPFLLWAALSARSWVPRVIALPLFLYGVATVIRTGSRGGMIACTAAALFFLFRGTARQRIVFAVAVPILIAALVAFTPSGTLRRLASFSTESEDASAEALGSAALRAAALQRSIEYAITHPVFGIGPAEFSDYSGTHADTDAGRANWIQPHNTYTQVASECGIPALLFFIAAVGSSLRLLNASWRKAREREDCRDIRNACFCVMLGMVGFHVAITFLSFAYFFYAPALGGLAIAVSRGAEAEMATRALGAAAEVDAGNVPRTLRCATP